MWNEAWARRKSLKSRQRANFMKLEAWTPHQRQYFGKFHDFPNFRSMEPGACLRITCLFRNAQPWYFQEMTFKHRRTQRFQNFFRIHHLRSRNSWSKFENLRIIRPPFVEQSPLSTLLLFGCNHSTNHVNDTWARRKALKLRQRTNFVILEAWTLHQRQYFGKFHDFQKFDMCT